MNAIDFVIIAAETVSELVKEQPNDLEAIQAGCEYLTKACNELVSELNGDFTEHEVVKEFNSLNPDFTIGQRYWVELPCFPDWPKGVSTNG